MDVEQELPQIATCADLASFVQALQDNLRQHPEEWQNDTLDHYFNALSAWLKDTDNPESANYPFAQKLEWRTFAEMLLAGKHYE